MEYIGKLERAALKEDFIARWSLYQCGLKPRFDYITFYEIKEAIYWPPMPDHHENNCERGTITQLTVRKENYSTAFVSLLRPPRGSVNLISTNLTNLLSLEQFHHKQIEMYGGGVPIGLWWNCSIAKRFVRLVEMSFTDPRGGLNVWTLNIAVREIKSVGQNIQLLLLLLNSYSMSTNITQRGGE